MVWLVFSVAGTRLALPAEAVSEIVFEPRLARPPGIPPAMAGVMNRGGTWVPVVLLARLLGLPDSPPGPFRKLVVMRRPAAAAPWAVVVDDVVEVAAADVPFSPAGDVPIPCVAGMSPHADGPVLLLSPECLLDRREVTVVEALRRRAAERWKEFGSVED